MNLSAQKLDLDERRRYIEVQIKKLKQDSDILKRGMEELDNGVDMLNGNSALSTEVRKIMRETLNM